MMARRAGTGQSAAFGAGGGDGERSRGRARESSPTRGPGRQAGGRLRQLARRGAAAARGERSPSRGELPLTSPRDERQLGRVAMQACRGGVAQCSRRSRGHGARRFTNARLTTAMVRAGQGQGGRESGGATGAESRPGAGVQGARGEGSPRVEANSRSAQGWCSRGTFDSVPLLSCSETTEPKTRAPEAMPCR
jgi:hypothetical protein